MPQVMVTLDGESNKAVEMYKASCGFRNKEEAINDLLKKLTPHIRKLTR